MCAVRAALLSGPGQLEIAEVPEPVATEGRVVVRVAANAICGSDLHSYRGHNPRNKYPKILGHETAGEVVELGGGVDGSWLGRRVAIEPNICCGICRWCRSGLANLCPDYHVMGESATYQGGCAEFVSAAVSQLYPLPDQVALEEGALVQPFGISYEAVVGRGDVREGESMLIIGAGPIGLAALMLARLRGARAAIIDVEDYRLRNAEDLGAALTCRADAEDLVEVIEGWTDGEGVDISIEAVGGPQHRTLETAQRLTRRRGRIVSVGEFTETLVPFPVRPLKNREQALLGSIGHPEAFAPVIDLMANGGLAAAALISHRTPLDGLADAFEMLDRKQNGVVKVVVTP